MRVLVVGSGAREHALCAGLARSPAVREVVCAPGNGGTAGVARSVPVGAGDVAALADAAARERADLVVVGPEAPLVAGLADALAARGVACFGPSAAAAALEGSKAWSKDFMRRHGIPTAAHATFTDADAAARYVRAQPHRVVVKASGLAGGKGVVVCDDADEAVRAVDDALRRRAFGAAGDAVVVEERLEGEEVSFHVVSDGARFVVLGGAQDHKRVGEHDTGPNTGGMGAYAPVPMVTPELEARVVDEVVRPTLDGMAREGAPFRGALFVGLMVQGGALRVLEYNARFGDPECAVLLARLDGDLAALLLGAARGDLRGATVRVRDEAVLGVVVAAAGYPSAPRTGDPIAGLDEAAGVPGVTIYHGGTRAVDRGLVTAGGRVLLVTATGRDVETAAARAYDAVERIRIPGAHYRRDIGWRARAVACPKKS